MEKSDATQVDHFVEKVYHQVEISALHRQMSKTTSEVAFAHQQRDNAYIVCNSAQMMSANSAAQANYYEQLAASQLLTNNSMIKNLVDAQNDAVRVRADNQILQEDLQAVKISKNLEPHEKLSAGSSAAPEACKVTAYFALPKEQQKSRNQPNAGECPCYYHVARALKIARTLDRFHREELDHLNYKQMVLEDELQALKVGLVRPRAETGCQTEGDWVEGEDASDAGSDESIEIVLSRSSSSPPSSFVSRK